MPGQSGNSNDFATKSPTATKAVILGAFEEPGFSQTLDALAEKHPRIYDVRNSMTWRLGREPCSGQVVDEATGHRLAESDPQGDVPAFWFFYRIEESGDNIALVLLMQADGDA